MSTDAAPDTELRHVHDELARWVREGLLTPEQAQRIEAAEALRTRPPTGGPLPPQLTPLPAPPAPPAPPHRIPMVVEALGYLGGLLAAIAGFIAVRQLWPGISDTGYLALAAAGTLALLAAGASVRAPADPAFARLRSALWALSTGSFGAFVALVVHITTDMEPLQTTLVVAASVIAYGTVLWLRTQALLQQVVVFAAGAVTAGTAVALAHESWEHWSAGLAVWAFALAWGAFAWRTERIPDREAAYVLSSLGLLVGAELTMQVPAGHALALITVGGLLAGGVLLRRVWLLGVGALGIVQVVPQTAARFLPKSVVAPVAVFVLGVALFAIAIWLSRHRRA